MLDVLEIGAPYGLIHGIEDEGLFVKVKIGIVADAIFEGINVLEKVDTAVGTADIEEGIGEFCFSVHKCCCLSPLIIPKIAVYG